MPDRQIRPQRPRRTWSRRRRVVVATAALALAGGAVVAIAPTAQASVPFPVASLDGRGNNVANPNWGRAGLPYSRIVPARYADGIGAQVAGPNSRYISNRIHNDTNQNLFSERRVTQWGFAWGQFLDHTFGLRRAPGVGNSPDPSSQNIAFDPNDPLEEFTNTLGNIPFTRSSITAGTGVTTPRQQDNTVPSYLDAFAVYSGTSSRLEWLREGSVDGNVTNNSARLLLPNNLLPRATARGNAATAPAMDVDGILRANPTRAMVAGDVRANENIGLTATHTLFAREHNRIVGLLPTSLSQEDRFQIARRIVMAEQQYITYNEFLPALGVALSPYTGYKTNVDATLGNEFATVAYRAHSLIHGEIETETELSRYTQAQLDAMEAQGLELAIDGDEIEIAIPLNRAFFNPDLLPLVGVGPVLRGLGLESGYKNDEQIDNQLRSVLFQVPVSGNPECLDGPTLPECFQGVVDLGAIDIERGRDHGMPSYNQLRQAVGLPAKTSFTSITGESTDQFPPGTGINNPNSLDFLSLRDIDGNPIDLDDEDAVEGTATSGTRRTTLAARLRAIYGNVNNVDAFVGMVSEAHVRGADFGELQLAVWKRQFTALRDGDRFFYGNDQGLNYIKSQYGIDFRRTLAQVIASNTDIPADELNANVFLVADADLPPATCNVKFTQVTSWPGNFQVNMTITNTGSVPINGWTMRFEFANGQRITQLWNGRVSQSGSNVNVVNESWNPVLNPGQSLDGVGFNATFDNTTNAKPPNFSINNRRCTVT